MTPAAAGGSCWRSTRGARSPLPATAGGGAVLAVVAADADPDAMMDWVRGLSVARARDPGLPLDVAAIHRAGRALFRGSLVGGVAR